ncbi:MFS transporter [Mycobacterium sp. NPDC050853]|uniref:MFS transporter n=1 Tax=Mycobacterium sp. NPDC050853 TaxID=3155160 RepID=UPI0033E1DD8F
MTAGPRGLSQVAPTQTADHTPAATAKTTPRKWMAVATVGVAVFAVTTTEMTPMGLLPSIAGDLHVSEGQAGLSVTLYGVLAGLLAPATTVLTGRIDRRTLLLTILAVFTVGNALSAASHNYALFMVSRFTCGLIHGLMWAIVASVAIRLVADRDAVRATAVVFSGISLALVLGVPCSAFLGSILGWRWAFALLSALCALTFVLVRLLLPALPSQRSFAFSDLVPLLKSKSVRRALIVTAGVVIGNYSAYTYIAPFLSGARGINDGLIGALLLSYGIAGVAGNFASAALLNRFRTIRPVLAGLTVVMTAGVLLMMIPTYSLLAIALWMAVWGAAYSALPVALQTLVLRVSDKRSGEATTSLYVLVFNCAIAVGALFGGIAIDSGGPRMPMLAGAMFCAASLVAICVIREATETVRPERFIPQDR